MCQMDFRVAGFLVIVVSLLLFGFVCRVCLCCCLSTVFLSHFFLFCQVSFFCVLFSLDFFLLFSLFCKFFFGGGSCGSGVVVLVVMA